MLALIIIYIITTFFISLILSLLYLIGELFQSNVSFYKLWLHSFLQLYGATNPAININYNYFQEIVFACSQVLKVILPSIFLSAIIFKLFTIPKIFTFRKKCSIFRDDERKKKVLAIRAYSSTQLTLLDVKFSIVARIPYRRQANNAKTLRNCYLDVESANWPIALTHIPKTLYIYLNDDDLVMEENEYHLYKLQGNKFSNDLKLLVVVSGKIPDLGMEFTEFHIYTLPKDIEWARFRDIQVDYDDSSRKWRGWDNFDDIEF